MKQDAIFNHSHEYLEPDGYVPYFLEDDCIGNDTLRMILRLLMRINRPKFQYRPFYPHYGIFVMWLVDCVDKRILKLDAFVVLIELYCKQSFVRNNYAIIRSLCKQELLKIPWIVSQVKRNPAFINL